MNILLALFALLNALDGWTTWQILRFGGYEQNSWMGKVIKGLGLYWALVACKVALVGAAWYFKDYLDFRALCLLDALYGVVVWHNLLQLEKHK